MNDLKFKMKSETFDVLCSHLDWKFRINKNFATNSDMKYWK